MLKNLVLVFIGSCLSFVVQAASFVLPNKGNMVGEVLKVYAKGGETLSEAGRRFDIGYNEMLKANPRVDPAVRLFRTVKLTIPSQFILPPGPRVGIVINLAELRLYYYPPDENIVITEPVGIGREGGWNTPIGTTSVVRKQVDPVWRPTANVRAEAASHGTPIPYRFPPGPNNPLGKYVLRLGWPTYLIHGTNRPEGVGARVSAGCIRMLPEDIKHLYDIVKVGTKVRVINEPFKLGHMNGHYYLEAHAPLEKRDLSKQLKRVQFLLKKSPKAQVTASRLMTVIEQASGMPVII